MRIRDLQFVLVEGHMVATTGMRVDLAQPLHIYAEYRPDRAAPASAPRTETVPASALYLKVLTDQGIEGLYGPIDGEAAAVVDRYLKPFVIGQDPLAGDVLWDKMYRSNRHARSGYYMMAISAIDNAVWDLRGRYFNAPVYRLLGGPSRAETEVYGSCLGFSIEPKEAAKKAAELKKQGYRHQKWFFAYGPGDGLDGLKKNVALVAALREAVGDDVDLMFDCFMSWDYHYARAWAQQVEPYRPRWIEEAFAPDRVEAFVQLRNSSTVPVATGEHFYTRWQVHDFLKAGAISVVQADPEWCGGISELAKICTVASLYDAQVVPHGHSLHAALHVVSSQPLTTCPLVEYLITKMEHYHHFEKSPLQVSNGRITLPDRPGFGIELDETKIEKSRGMTWS